MDVTFGSVDDLGPGKVIHVHEPIRVPDFIANVGGVICAAMEYQGATEVAALAAIEEKIRANTKTVLDAATTKRIPPRRAAVELATARVRESMSYRRFSLF